MNIIKMQEVTRSYQMGETSLHVLRGVNLTIEEGEFIAFGFRQVDADANHGTS